MLTGPYVLGWQIVSDAAVSDLHLTRPQIRQVHPTTMHHPPSRAIECPRGNICTQSLILARDEDSQWPLSPAMEGPANLLVR